MSSSASDMIQTFHGNAFHGTCGETYQEDRESYEFFLYGSAAIWLFATVVFLPQPTNTRGTRHSCLVDCCRGMFFCLESCRPLLENDIPQVVGTAHVVRKGPAVVFLGIFGLLQLVPPVALIVGRTQLYPSCGCLTPDVCQCTFKIDGIPVGSCSGVAMVVMILVSLASLVFLKRAVRALRAVLSHTSTTVTATMPYASVRTEDGTQEESNSMDVDVAEQEMVDVAEQEMV